MLACGQPTIYKAAGHVVFHVLQTCILVHALADGRGIGDWALENTGARNCDAASEFFTKRISASAVLPVVPVSRRSDLHLYVGHLGSK